MNRIGQLLDQAFFDLLYTLIGLGVNISKYFAFWDYKVTLI